MRIKCATCCSEKSGACMQPTKPVNPMKPVKPVNHTKLLKPVNPMKPVKLVNLTKLLKPVNYTASSESSSKPVIGKCFDWKTKKKTKKTKEKNNEHPKRAIAGSN